MSRSSGSKDGFLSSIRSSFLPDSSSSSAQQQQQDGGSYLPNPSNLLVDLAPNLLTSTSRMLHPSNVSAHQASLASGPSSSAAAHPPSTTTSLRRKISFIRSGLSIGRPNAPLQSWTDLSTQLYLRDRVEDLLRLPVPAAPFDFSSASGAVSSGQAGQLALEAPPPRPNDPVPLYQGFRATIPAAQASKAERRRRRALLSEKALGLEQGGKLGLKARGERARGSLMLGEFGEIAEEDEDALPIGRRSKGRRKGKAVEDNGTSAPLESRDELEKDAKEVEGDMANVAVRRALVNGQVKEVEDKIAALEKVREDLRRGLLGLREEELELEDERACSLSSSWP